MCGDGCDGCACAGWRGCTASSTTSRTTTGLVAVWGCGGVNAGRFMKADDDTYVVMKNLREFLAKYDPNDMHYFGLGRRAGRSMCGLGRFCRARVHSRRRAALSEWRRRVRAEPGGAGQAGARDGWRLWQCDELQGANPWSFPETVYDHEKSEDLEFARALLKLDIHIENVAGPDGLASACTAERRCNGGDRAGCIPSV